jgi:hypothetical protein
LAGAGGGEEKRGARGGGFDWGCVRPCECCGSANREGEEPATSGAEQGRNMWVGGWVGLDLLALGWLVDDGWVGHLGRSWAWTQIGFRQTARETLFLGDRPGKFGSGFPFFQLYWNRIQMGTCTCYLKKKGKLDS